MYTLKEIILSFVKKNPELNEQVLVNLYDYWKETVGELIAKVSYPDYLKDNKLVVIVKNAVWLNQLKLMKKDILVKLKNKDGIKIDNIDFKIERKKKRFDKSCEQLETKKDCIVRVDPEIEDKINKSLEAVKDEEIKELLRSIFIKSYYLK